MANKNSFWSSKQEIGYFKQDDASNQWDDEQNPASDAFITSLSEGTSPDDQPEVTTEAPNLTSSNGSMPEESRTYVDAKSGLDALQHRVYANATELPHLMVAAFQAGTQGAATAYAKSIYPANDPSIQFSNNEGFLFTVCRTVPSGHAYILKNALIRELVFTHDKAATGVGRHAMIDSTWVGVRNSSTVTAVSTSTWGTQPSLSSAGSGFTDGYLTLKFGSDSAIADICYKTFEMRVSNDVENACPTAGLPGDYSFVQGQDAVTFNIDMPYNADTKDMLADYANAEVVELEWKRNSSDTGLIIDFDECQISTTPGGYDGDRLAQRLSLRVLRPTAGFGTSSVNHVSITDNTDWGY